MNPLRAGLVPDLYALGRYPQACHSALTGQVKREWQDTGTIRDYFNRSPKEWGRRYKAFVAEVVGQGRRPELVKVCRASAGEMGYPAAGVVRFLGVTTSAVVRAARAEELPDQLPTR